MTTPDQSSPGEQPGIASPAIPTDGAQPQGSIDLNSYTEEQLLEAITSEAPKPQTTPEKPPEKPPEATPVPAGEQPPEDEEEAPEPTVDTDPKPKPESIRLRLNGLPPEQQQETAEAMRMVRDKKATDLFDALLQIRGTKGTEPAPAPSSQQPEAAPPAQAIEEPAAIEQRLTELRAQRRTAKEEFDLEAEDRLSTEIEDTIGKLHEARFAVQQRQATEQSAQKAEQQYNADYLKAVEEIETKYPQIADDESQFAILLDDKLAAARHRNDPALNDPRHVITLAEEVAQLLKPKAPARPPAAPPAPKRPTGEMVAPANVPVPRPSEDQVRALINNASADDLLAAIAQ